MKKIFGILVITLLITITTLPVLGTICNAGITNGDQLHQSQIVDDTYYILYKDHDKAQSFTPSFEILTRVELKIDKMLLVGTSWIHVYIRSNIDGSNLALKSLETDDISPGLAWLEFDFFDIEVTPGNTYFIVAKATWNQMDPCNIKIHRSNQDEYASGDAWVYTDAFGWSKTTVDLCFKTYGKAANNPPTIQTCRYEKNSDELVVSATDYDGDQIRYGVSWDNDNIIDYWTAMYNSGVEARISCNGRTGTVGVIAEDENGAQSDWASIKTKNKAISIPFLEFFENHFQTFRIFQNILK